MAQQKQQESAYDIMAKGATSFLKAKSTQEKAKIDMQTKLLMKQIEDKQNYMYKIAEKEHMGPYERMMMEQYQKQQGGGGGMPGGAPSGMPGGAPGGAPGGMPGVGVEQPGGMPSGMPGGMPGGAGQPQGDPFAPTAGQRTRITPGAKGFTTKTIGMKDAIYQNIARKPEEQRSEKERKFVENYLGTAQKGVTATQSRKEELQTKEVLEILNRGTWYSQQQGKAVQFKDRQEALDYIMDNYDIDISDPKVQESLAKYAAPEEEITAAGGGFLGMGRRKYPTKQKYGHTYEKRDGAWHKITE